MPKYVNIPYYQPYSHAVDELVHHSSQLYRASKNNPKLHRYYHTAAINKLLEAVRVQNISPSDEAYCMRRMVSIQINSNRAIDGGLNCIGILDYAEKLLLTLIKNHAEDLNIIYELHRVLREKAHLALQLKDGELLDAALQTYQEIKGLAENPQLEIEFKDREYTLLFAKNDLPAAKAVCIELLSYLEQQPKPWDAQLKQMIFTQQLHLHKIKLIEIGMMPSRIKRELIIKSSILTDQFWNQYDVHKIEIKNKPWHLGAIKQIQKDLIFLFTCKLLSLNPVLARNYVLNQIAKMDLPVDTTELLRISCRNKFHEATNQNVILLSHSFFSEYPVPKIENIRDLQADDIRLANEGI